ncbi:MAG: hypothetical protein P8M34_15535 [Saprospiraceae bacterium]|nr:hypothetical protein [Saprospiraceae bacterium]|tara:strand:+ start:534 stop:716 length:183 start_codon:yes stop_codon:yes gene_type:complete
MLFFSIRISTSNPFGFHAKLTNQGIKSTAPTQVVDIIRADNVADKYLETIYPSDNMKRGF